MMASAQEIRSILARHGTLARTIDRISDDEAADLDRRIYRNYLNKDWLNEVVTKRARIELMFNDPYWARYKFTTSYPWEVLVFNVNPPEAEVFLDGVGQGASSLYPEEWARVASGLEPGTGNAHCLTCDADYFVEAGTITLLSAREDPFGFAEIQLGRLLTLEEVRWLAVGKESPRPGVVCADC